MESSYFDTPSIRDKWGSAQNKRRNFCCIIFQSGLDEKCGLIPWNAIAICETFKISWQMGRLRMKDDSENHSEARSYSSVQ